MTDALICFENVSYSYEGDDGELLDPALHNINLCIGEGEFVAVLGHNGSGKSTLSKLCNAMLLPTQGKVTVRGLDTAEEKNELDVRTTVGVVMQNPDNQIVATIVEEDVAFGPENLGVEQKELRVRVDEALKAVGMYELRNHEPHKLSGGQKQRVAIAGVIAMQTKCIVLDEPTAMLDPSGRREVMKTVKRLNRDKGISVVFITHFMDEAVDADRVVVIDGGEIILDGTPKQVFSHRQQLENVGLDIPEAAKLASLLRERGVRLPDGIISDEEFEREYLKLWKESAR